MKQNWNTKNRNANRQITPGKWKRLFPCCFPIVCIFLVMSCSTTRKLTEGEILYTGVKKMKADRQHCPMNDAPRLNPADGLAVLPVAHKNELAPLMREIEA